MSSAAENRLALLEALSRALADLPALLALLADAEDESGALRRLADAYDFTPEQAQAVLDLQFRRVIRGHRAALDAELRGVSEALAGTWDPPLHLVATGHSPQLVELVIAGGTHRVEGADLDDCLDRLVSLVRERLAGPERRRVAVTTGLADGPTRILIDPLGGAEFFYDS